MTPLEALTGRRRNVAGFRVWGSRAWALKPKKQQRKLEPRTDVGRFVGYAVGGKAYRILHDGADKVSERGDVLMEESPAKEVKEESSAASSAGPQLTPQDDARDSAGTDGEIDMLDAEGGSGDDYVPDLPSDSDEDDDAPHCPSCGAKDDEGKDCSTHQDERDAPESVGASKDQGEPRPLRSKRRPAPKVTLWTMDPKAYLAIGTDASAKDGWDLTKPPANEKEAPARSDWLL